MKQSQLKHEQHKWHASLHLFVICYRKLRTIRLYKQVILRLTYWYRFYFIYLFSGVHKVSHVINTGIMAARPIYWSLHLPESRSPPSSGKHYGVNLKEQLAINKMKIPCVTRWTDFEKWRVFSFFPWGRGWRIQPRTKHWKHQNLNRLTKPLIAKAKSFWFFKKALLFLTV